MKKLFKAIRGGDLDEVKAIISKNPEALSCTAVPPPKKDIGQSPLQVAVKIGEFDIAYYLMECGADVDFMEEEAEEVTWRTPILHDAIRTVLQSLCYGDADSSEKGLELTRELLKRGADPNKPASNGFAALDECVAEAERILDNREAYPNVQEITEKHFTALLDMLIESGADFRHWAERGHFPEPAPMEPNRVRYLEDFVPQPDRVQELKIRGRVSRTVIKGDIDRTAHTRAVMREYCQRKHLL